MRDSSIAMPEREPQLWASERVALSNQRSRSLPRILNKLTAHRLLAHKLRAGARCGHRDGMRRVTTPKTAPRIPSLGMTVRDDRAMTGLL